MNYNDVKRILVQCPALSDLDEVSQGLLLRHGDELVLDSGELIYGEGADLDDTFCVLLSGSVAIEKGGKMVAESSKSHVFGDMAYFSAHHKRTATVRAYSPKTSVLKIQLRASELNTDRYASLRRHLALQPWLRPVG